MDISSLYSLPFFTIETLKTVFGTIRPESARQKIARWTRQKKIIPLKRGFYTTGEYFNRHKTDSSFQIFIANTLRYPSYVSSAYVLQQYDILTEMTYPITSVTLKSSRKYANALGNFIYYSVSEKLYTGYTREEYEGNAIYIATKAKALFDFLYFKYFKIPVPLDLEERERLDLENFTKKEREEFKKYCNMATSKKMKKIYTLLFHA